MEYVKSKHKKNMRATALLIGASIVLAACSYDSAKLEEENRERHEKTCEKVMSEMEVRLSEKYADILGKDQSEILFDVYDISKGGHKAWFQSGFYPAKAVCKEGGEEFTVQIEITEPNAKGFGDIEDNFYGILYGNDQKEALSKLARAYEIEELNIYYEPCKTILTDEKELREHLTIFGNFTINNDDDTDTACEMADRLNDFGCKNMISVDGFNIGKGATGIGGKTQKEIREFFS